MIPFEQLYNFLDSASHCDLLIYRFLPAGSKNLEDCQPLHAYYTFNSYFKQVTTPNIIFHDQEPLFWDHYTEIKQWVIDNHVHEGETGLPYWPDELIDHVAHSNLKAVIKPVFNSIYDKVLLVHSEKRSPELDKYENNNFIGVYYWSHALIAQDWYRYAAVDPELTYSDQFKHDFVIYGRAWSGSREYRLKFFDLLVAQQLNTHCLAKFAAHDNGQHYTDHQYVNPALRATNTNIEYALDVNTAPSHASATYSSHEYQQAAVDVVLETLFDDPRIQLTEKILRPIACGKPFILASTHGSLQHLRNYGFKTFGEYIDESYDCIEDPVLRLQAITNTMQQITNHPDKETLYANLHKIAKYNRARFHSREFHDSIVDEYQTNLTCAVSICNQQASGKSLKYWRKIYADNDLARVWLKHHTRTYLSDYQKIFKKIK